MKKKIHLRKKKKHFVIRKSHLFLFTMIGVVVTVIFFLYQINRHFTPLLFEMAELEIQKFSTIMVNKAIAQVLEDKINTDELFETVKSEDGSIQTIDFNPVVVNQVLNLATTIVQNNLKLLEHGELDAIGIYDMDLPEDRILSQALYPLYSQENLERLHKPWQSPEPSPPQRSLRFL